MCALILIIKIVFWKVFGLKNKEKLTKNLKIIQFPTLIKDFNHFYTVKLPKQTSYMLLDYNKFEVNSLNNTSKSFKTFKNNSQKLYVSDKSFSFF